jgi:hypothetical protein
VPSTFDCVTGFVFTVLTPIVHPKKGALICSKMAPIVVGAHQALIQNPAKKILINPYVQKYV